MFQPPELTAAETSGDDRARIRIVVVHHVKEFGAKLDGPGFFEAERFVGREIDILNARQADRAGAW